MRSEKPHHQHERRHDDDELHVGELHGDLRGPLPSAIAKPPLMIGCSGFTRAPCDTCTKFCRTIDMPIAVMSGASRNEPRSGR